MIDSHSHLYFDSFDDDRQETIERAAAAGVEAHIIVGIDVESSLSALAMADSYDSMHATAGIHPNHSSEQTDAAWARIESLLESGQFVAIGETGLDFFRDRTPREQQEAALSRHIDWSRRLDLPLIIHCRDAQDALLTQLESEAKGISGIMHCFSGDRADLTRALDLGFDISYAGPLTYRKNNELRACCTATPIDRIHIETDCPFLPPQPKRGKRNEPVYMTHLLHQVSECVGKPVSEVNAQTTANTKRLFRLP